MGTEVKNIYYNEKLVITGRSIDRLCNKKKYYYSSVITRAIKSKKIKENIDYSYLNAEEFFNISGLYSAGKGAYVLYESGARKIIKEDDNQYINGYFSQDNKLSNNSQKNINDINKEVLNQGKIEKENKIDKKHSVENKKNKTTKKEDSIEYKQEELQFNNNCSEAKIENKTNLKLIEKSELSVNNKVDTPNNNIPYVSYENANSKNDLIIAECFNSMNNIMTNFIQMHKEIIQQQNEMHSQFRNEMKELFLTMKNDFFVSNVTSKDIINTINSNNSLPEITTTNYNNNNFNDITDLKINDINEEDISVLNNNNSYYEWKKPINKAANIILKITNKYKSKNEIFSNCYASIENDTEIAIEEEKQKFYDQYNRSPVNKLELIYYIENKYPEYKNILFAKLNTIYGEIKSC